MTRLAVSMPADQVNAIDLALRATAAEKIPVAKRDAVNKTVRSVKSIVLDVLTQQLPIKRRDLDTEKVKHRHGGVSMRLATKENPTGAVLVTGKRITLSRFMPRPKEPVNMKGMTFTSRGVRGQISFQVRRGPGNKRAGESKGRRWVDELGTARKTKKPFKRKRIPRKLLSWQTDRRQARRKAQDAFLVRFKSGHLAVVYRPDTLAKSQSVEELYGPSIPHAAEQDPVLASKLKVDATDILQKNVASQIGRFLK